MKKALATDDIPTATDSRLGGLWFHMLRVTTNWDNWKALDTVKFEHVNVNFTNIKWNSTLVRIKIIKRSCFCDDEGD